MKPDRQKVCKLQGKVMHYAWGGSSFLPHLLHLPNSEGRPFAEYWMGAHDNASSELEFSSGPEDSILRVKLNEYIRASPEELLGKYTAGRFGRLPYLLKILDVRDMLSIQVHPSQKQAGICFAEENRKGIPLDAPDRNYKDDNHKPELMVALSDFWLLHGFKPGVLLEKIFLETPELRFLDRIFFEEGYAGLYRAVMEMPQPQVNESLQPLIDRILPAYHDERLSKNQEDFWAARAALTFNETSRIDRGIFSIYLFNLVNLHAGEAIFQDAGVPHAYLEGQNVEIMANSDNVLRGGLTPKHIDVPELLRHIRFEETRPHVIRGEDRAGAGAFFKTPAPDFELSRIDLFEGESLSTQAHTAEIFFILEGELEITGEAEPLFTRNGGEAFIMFDGGRVRLKAGKNSALYRAGVPAPEMKA